jgi:TonB family protein
LRLELPAGRVALVIEKDGFRPWRQEVTLRAGQLQISARLVPLLPPSPEAGRPGPGAARAGEPVPIGPDVTPPRRVSGDSPVLPEAAKRLKLAGSVLVEFVVDEQGRVASPRIIDSAGQLLDEACLEAVKRWRYEPAKRGGAPVKFVQKAKFTFESR